MTVDDLQPQYVRTTSPAVWHRSRWARHQLDAVSARPPISQTPQRDSRCWCPNTRAAARCPSRSPGSSRSPSSRRRSPSRPVSSTLLLIDEAEAVSTLVQPAGPVSAPEPAPVATRTSALPALTAAGHLHRFGGGVTGRRTRRRQRRSAGPRRWSPGAGPMPVSVAASVTVKVTVYGPGAL